MYPVTSSKVIKKNSKFKISAPSWDEEFELSDGSYFVSDMEDYVEYFIKQHEALTNKPLIQIYVNKLTKELHSNSNQGIILSF